MRNIALIAFFGISLGGCSTTPVSQSLAIPAPQNSVLLHQTKDVDHSSVIIVTRDKGLTGSACKIAVRIDGNLAARLSPKQTASFFVTAGEHTIRAEGDPLAKGLCGINKNEGMTTETITKADVSKYFRLTINSGGILIQRVDN